MMRLQYPSEKSGSESDDRENQLAASVLRIKKRLKVENEYNIFNFQPSVFHSLNTPDYSAGYSD
jgi:hypothetical protein